MLNSVLLIDDDEVNNYINQRLLKKLQLAENVVVKKSGADALSHLAASANLPELVFLDINMPVMDGFEFYAKFKEILTSSGKRSEVVMLSGSEKPDDHIRARREGIKYFIMKPLIKDEVRSLVETIIKEEQLI